MKKNLKITLIFGLVSFQFAAEAQLTFKCESNCNTSCKDNDWSKVIIEDDGKSGSYFPMPNNPDPYYSNYSASFSCKGSSDSLRCGHFLGSISQYWESNLIFVKEKDNAKLLWVDWASSLNKTYVTTSTTCILSDSDSNNHFYNNDVILYSSQSVRIDNLNKNKFEFDVLFAEDFDAQACGFKLWANSGSSTSHISEIINDLMVTDNGSVILNRIESLYYFYKADTARHANHFVIETNSKKNFSEIMPKDTNEFGIVLLSCQDLKK